MMSCCGPRFFAWSEPLRRARATILHCRHWRGACRQIESSTSPRCEAPATVAGALHSSQGRSDAAEETTWAGGMQAARAVCYIAAAVRFVRRTRLDQSIGRQGAPEPLKAA